MIESVEEEKPPEELPPGHAGRGALFALGVLLLLPALLVGLVIAIPGLLWMACCMGFKEMKLEDNLQVAADLKALGVWMHKPMFDLTPETKPTAVKNVEPSMAEPEVEEPPPRSTITH